VHVRTKVLWMVIVLPEKTPFVTGAVSLHVAPLVTAEDVMMIEMAVPGDATTPPVKVPACEQPLAPDDWKVPLKLPPFCADATKDWLQTPDVPSPDDVSVPVHWPIMLGYTGAGGAAGVLTVVDGDDGSDGPSLPQAATKISDDRTANRFTVLVICILPVRDAESPGHLFCAVTFARRSQRAVRIPVCPTVNAARSPGLTHRHRRPPPQLATGHGLA
jgi:hypothetical protein